MARARGKSKVKAKAKAKPAKKPTTKRAPRKGSARAKRPGNSAPTKKAPSSGRSRASLTPQQKAARTRKANLARERELESIRASSAAKAAKTRKRKRAAREREGIIEAKIARAPKKTQALYDTISSALERMRRSAPFRLSLEYDVPPAEEGSSQLWLVRGTFTPTREGFGYAELAETFQTWRNDLVLEASVHPQRITFIRWNYQGGRKNDGYAPTGLGAWERVIDEAEADADDFAERYSESVITSFSVQFAARTLTGPIIRL